MLEFFAVNFNLPTLLVAAVVFGGTGWLLHRARKAGGGCSGCSGGCAGCPGGCRGGGSGCHGACSHHGTT